MGHISQVLGTLQWSTRSENKAIRQVNLPKELGIAFDFITQFSSIPAHPKIAENISYYQQVNKVKG
jgi:hypothetical protein